MYTSVSIAGFVGEITDKAGTEGEGAVLECDDEEPEIGLNGFSSVTFENSEDVAMEGVDDAAHESVVEVADGPNNSFPFFKCSQSCNCRILLQVEQCNRPPSVVTNPHPLSH